MGTLGYWHLGWGRVIMEEAWLFPCRVSLLDITYRFVRIHHAE